MIPSSRSTSAPPPNRKLQFEEPKGLWERLTTSLPSIKFNREVGFYAEQRGLTIELFLKSFDVPMGLITRMRLAVHPPDLLLEPDLPEDIGIEDFVRAEEILDLGYAEASAKLPAFLTARG